MPENQTYIQHPLQNRLTPDGEIIATPARGLFMGNRGILHHHKDHKPYLQSALKTATIPGRLGHRKWQHKNWVTCLTEFKGRKRKLMSANRYTELFFLDEVTALAAGHRPCWECRRNDYKAYWQALASQVSTMPDNAKALDDQLHSERVIAGKNIIKTWKAPINQLPSGTMIKLPSSQDIYLVHNKHLLQWTTTGYHDIAQSIPHHDLASVTVLTPPTTVLALKGGYAPVYHPSCNQAS